MYENYFQSRVIHLALQRFRYALFRTVLRPSLRMYVYNIKRNIDF